MIQLRDIFLSYGDKTVLRRCSLSIRAGERVALTGPSGCGKTTLLHLLAGLQKPQSGEIMVASEKISLLFQEPRLLPWRTAAENVNLVAADGPGTMGAARALLERAGLGEAADLYPAALSGGMAQRVALCRTLHHGGDLFLLDEPLKGLDPQLSREIAALIAEKTAGKTLLLVTHNPQEAAGCDRILTFADGKFGE